MSTSTSHRWAIRVFRIWFVLFLPAAAFFSFHLVQSSLQIAEGYRDVHAWIELEQQREAKGLREPVTNADVQFKLLERDYAQLAERRKTSAVLLLIALAVQALCFLVARLIRWIWGASSPALATANDQEARTLSKYKAIYFWGAGIAAALLLTYFLSPERAMQTAVSGIIQATGIALVAWLISRFWRCQSK